jgi:membrane fusion protein (multidrug efflux system)
MIGTRREGRVEIVEGLSAGDQVVTAGQLKIRDGAAVSIANGTGA